MTYRFIIIVVLLSGLLRDSYAQSGKAILQFQQDSLLLGQTVELRLLVEHPVGTDVILPNQSRNFMPFEMLTYEVEPTRTVNDQEWDVVQYQLRSFEVEAGQSISLQVGYLQGRDTSWEDIQSDTIFLVGLVSGDLEDLDYHVYEDLILLDDPPNYLMTILLGTGLLCLIVVLYLVLRKPIQRYLDLRSLQLEWQQVRRKLRKLEQSEDQSLFFPAVNDLWKSYLDPEEQMALRSMTTTELREVITRVPYLTVEQQRDLIEIARASDAVIYAGAADSRIDLNQIILSLRKVLKKSYEQKKLALQGKVR